MWHAHALPEGARVVSKKKSLEKKERKRNDNKGWGPITSSTVFHSLQAMQDFHLCMYVCM